MGKAKCLQTGVLVVSNTKQPLMPTSERRARQLLKTGRAAIFKRFPFTIIITETTDEHVQPVRLKLDPGSKEGGVVLINSKTHKVVFAMEIHHRGMAISLNLIGRSALRRGRRFRNTRYRRPGLPNTQKPSGWIAPSLMHRILTVETWVRRLCKLSPVTDLSMELVKFDLQLLENPSISGKEYQQGTLVGYETREYLLEKWDRACSYCGAKNVPLQVEHIHCRAKGGSDRISNLALACDKCNKEKDSLDIREFLPDKPALLNKILAQTKSSLRDAAAVNSTRLALYERLKAIGLPVETGSGGRTKFNRTKQGYPKAHWIDAACVGESGESVIIPVGTTPMIAKAAGHGNRQMCGTDQFGFPTRHRSRQKYHFGFQTGDMVKAVVPSGKRKGTHVGRVLCRATGSFDISTKAGRVQGVSHKYCKSIHRNDGYNYFKKETGTENAFLPRLKS